MGLKELAKIEPKFVGGHRLCSGCGGAALPARQVLLAAGNKNIVAGVATGCTEVSTTIFPYTAWDIPLIHTAFANVASTISGVEVAYRALKRKGKIKEDINFIAFAGDGGFYDIGLQSLSGAVERGHNILFVCNNNEAYMNTGVQRSGATPLSADTTTAPVGRLHKGKEQYPKDLTEIMVAHKIPYVAQAAIGFADDLIMKVQKALEIKGPKFINILSPCRLGWEFLPKDTLKVGRMATETNFWPLYEVENGEYKINYKPKQRKPIMEWFLMQKRFKHLMLPENKNLVNQIQKDIDQKWQELLKKTK